MVGMPWSRRSAATMLFGLVMASGSAFAQDPGAQPVAAAGAGVAALPAPAATAPPQGAVGSALNSGAGPATEKEICPDVGVTPVHST